MKSRNIFKTDWSVKAFIEENLHKPPKLLVENSWIFTLASAPNLRGVL